MRLEWEAVSWGEKLLNVKREKRGITPWVPILPEMETLLRAMQKRAHSHLLFHSPFDLNKQRDASALRNRLTAACKALALNHVTPHGLRSYFVTQARESGLSDAEIAMLIGDRSGPAIIAHTYGDVRSDHLLKQAQRIRLTVQPTGDTVAPVSSTGSSTTSQDVASGLPLIPQAAEVGIVPELQGVAGNTSQPAETF